MKDVNIWDGLGNSKKRKRRDFVDMLMAYEAGELSDEETYAFFKKYKSKLIGLQGHYGRTLARMGLLD